MKRRNLFDIQDEYLEYLDELEQFLLDNPDADGEIPDDIMERLNINMNEVETKLSNYHRFIMQLEAETQVLEDEIDRLRIKIKAKNKTVTRLKDLMSFAVKLYGEVNIKSKAKVPSKVIEGDLAKFTFIYSEKTIIDEELLPIAYTRANIQFKCSREEYAKIYSLLSNIDFYLANIVQQAKVKNEVDKDKIEQSLALGNDINGVTVDKNAGYIKIS